MNPKYPRLSSDPRQFTDAAEYWHQLGNDLIARSGEPSDWQMSGPPRDSDAQPLLGDGYVQVLSLTNEGAKRWVVVNQFDFDTEFRNVVASIEKFGDVDVDFLKIHCILTDDTEKLIRALLGAYVSEQRPISAIKTMIEDMGVSFG